MTFRTDTAARRPARQSISGRRIEQVTRIGTAVQAMLSTGVEIDGVPEPAAGAELIVRYVG